MQQRIEQRYAIKFCVRLGKSGASTLEMIQQAVRMIVEQLGMDRMVVHKIISEDLGMRKICTKLMPKVLTDVQKFPPIGSSTTTMRHLTPASWLPNT
ncbi:hypothetical protein TNCV_5035471 [Trichonephila clavipes]|nr:hypothetical protein TNCV_5035471 [Trichonephila clavipes]